MQEMRFRQGVTSITHREDDGYEGSIFMVPGTFMQHYRSKIGMMHQQVTFAVHQMTFEGIHIKPGHDFPVLVFVNDKGHKIYIELRGTKPDDICDAVEALRLQEIEA